MSNVHYLLPKPTWEDFLTKSIEDVEVLLVSITEEHNAAYHALLEQIMFNLVALERELEKKSGQGPSPESGKPA